MKSEVARRDDVYSSASANGFDGFDSFDSFHGFHGFHSYRGRKDFDLWRQVEKKRGKRREAGGVQ